MIREDAMEFPGAVAQEAALKQKSKMKFDLKEALKYERKATRVPKKELKKDLLLLKSE